MQINTHSVELSPKLRSMIQEEHMYLYRFNVFILLLKCDIEVLDAAQDTYQVTLTLYLQDQTFKIVSCDWELEDAIEEAFLSLQEKMMRHKAKLRLGFIREKLERLWMLINPTSPKMVKRVRYY